MERKRFFFAVDNTSPGNGSLDSIKIIPLKSLFFLYFVRKIIILFFCYHQEPFHPHTRLLLFIALHLALRFNSGLLYFRSPPVNPPGQFKFNFGNKYVTKVWLDFYVI